MAPEAPEAPEAPKAPRALMYKKILIAIPLAAAFFGWRPDQLDGANELALAREGQESSDRTGSDQVVTAGVADFR